MSDTTNQIVDSREGVYGEAVETHRRIAEVWSGILGTHVNTADVPLMMMGLKIVRTQICPDYSDNSDDIEGYLDIFRKTVGDEMVQVRTVDQYLEVKSWSEPPLIHSVPTINDDGPFCKHCGEEEVFHNPTTQQCAKPGFDACRFEPVEP